MKKIVKSFSALQYFALLMGLFLMIFLSVPQKVTAEEQKKIPYLIKVNRAYNTITVYEQGEDGTYSLPVKAMICSVGRMGTQTVLGTFQTKEKYRWKELLGDVWGQYATRIVGRILFHSVYYYDSCNPASLATREFNKLGSAASHGCIRLTVEDAKWIYDNCAVGTTVVIYDDKKSPGPLGKPEAIKLPTAIRWDPTDPSEKNPYKDKLPLILGAKDLTVQWGEKVDLLSGISAKSSLGADITSRLIFQGDMDSKTPGKYEIIYSITDELGRLSSKTITVVVKDYMEAPVLKGISDKVAKADILIDREYALSGVEAYSSDTKLDKDLINVIIEKVSEVEYKITYSINLNIKQTTTEYATIIIDKEAPTFHGLTDKLVETGEVPDPSSALDDIEVLDNYTTMSKKDILVTIKENPEGGYFIIYEAADQAGNVAKEQIRYYN